MRLEIGGATPGSQVCKQLLEVVCHVLTQGEPAVISIPDTAAGHPDVLAVLQALIMRDEVPGLFTPASLEQAFGGDPELIAEVCAQLAPELDAAQARTLH
jgi:hypothetical protein